jgi:hypothetical protein
MGSQGGSIGSSGAASLHSEQRLAVIHGGEQFVAGCQATWLTYGGDPRMQFGATNVLVDVADSLDSATCHSYFFLFQGLGPRDPAPDQLGDAFDMALDPNHGIPSEFPLQLISCGRYLDAYQYLEEPARWQIVSREIFADFAGDASRHMRGPAV